MEESLKAKALFQLDKHYIVEKGEIIIIDEFTGRKMYGRRYSGGLHQAIEAKEGVAVNQSRELLLQSLFKIISAFIKKIGGMTGTAQTSAEEFHKVYNLDVISIPTNKPMIRKDLTDMVYKDLEAKYRAATEEIKTGI